MSEDQNGSDVKFTDWLNPSTPRASEELAESRLKICQTCEFFKVNGARCKKCGCFMKAKTTLEMAKCPVGKW